MLGLLLAVSCSNTGPRDVHHSDAQAVLRVGTTGDYLPFSLRTERGFEGSDIALALRFADSIGASVQWVQTSWPSLVSDAEANRFDLALSGITITEGRRERVAFSSPYYQGQKLALIRCSDRERFRDLQSTNRPEVTVLTNPGGTNEQVVRQHLAQATITVIPDNTQIFRHVAHGVGDVMITDDIEATLQSSCDPALCTALHQEQLAPFEIAALFPQQSSWHEVFERWLADEDTQSWLRRERSDAARQCPPSREDAPGSSATTDSPIR